MDCEWCYSPAAWQAQTPNGPRNLCQRHYDELVRERDTLTRDLPEALLDLVTLARHETRG
jgi:organic radical activating enzyme